MMRVLLLDHSHELSGAQVSLLEMVTALGREECEFLAVIPRPGRWSDRLQAAGVRVAHWPIWRLQRRGLLFRAAGHLTSLVRVVPRLVRLIQCAQVDLVHSNSTSAHLYGGLAARLAGKPALWHARDLTSLCGSGSLLSASATRVIAISEAVKVKLILEGVAEQKIRVVYNGVDVHRFHPSVSGDAVRRDWGFAADDFVFGMVSQLVPWKGPHRFVAAASMIPDARCVLVGDDVFGDHPDYVSRLGEQTEVRRVGFRTDMPEVMAALDALVLPSVCEPFGRVLIEAMACGKPVIACRSGGVPEIVEEDVQGLLVEPGSVDDLVTAMKRLRRNPDLCSRMGQAGRDRVEQRFGLARASADLLEVYRRASVQ